jgi:diphosphomevalonate decarboxylase
MKKVIARAPINIALIKYWGKANASLVLPTTTSVSLTLQDLYTETIIEQGQFAFYLNDALAKPEEIARVKDVLKHFQHDQVVIRSTNHFPTASGLASSASGLAALTTGLNAFFEANYTLNELVTLTRLGSGSACRSLVDGFAIWHQQGHVETITNPFQDLMMIVMLVSTARKTISSRDAMAITKDTSPKYDQWIQESHQDYLALRQAIDQHSFHRLGEVMEQNSQRLHAVMASSQPPIVYQQAESLVLLDLVKQARKEGLFGYSTMDAGPNVKILIRGEDQSKWQAFLKKNTTLPYLISRIGGKAYAQAG